MRVLSRRFAIRIAMEERRRAMDALQADQMENHLFLRTVDSLGRYRKSVEWTGRILVAVLLACIAVALNYLFFVRMLHYQFDLWR